MKKIDSYSNNRIVESIAFGIISLGIIALAAYLILVGVVDGFSAESVILILFVSFLGISMLVISIIGLIKSIFRKGEINKVMKNPNFVMAHIDGEKSSNYEGTIITCSAEINGTKQEFNSDPVKFDFMYAVKELGVEEIKVYIDQNDPTKYVVDTREIEDRVVDLT